MATDDRDRDALADVLALKGMAELAAVPPDALFALASRARPLGGPPGTRLPTGDGAIVLLLDGRVRGDAGSDAHQGPALLALVPALAGRPTPSWTAETDVDALQLARADLLDVLEDDFELWLAVLRLVCQAGPLDAIAAAPPPARGAEGEDGAGLAERIVALRGAAPFASLPIALLGEIAAALQPRRLEPGEALWTAGEPATHALWIVAGVAVSEMPPRRAGPGAWVGLGEALAGRAYGATLRAATAVRALELEGETLIDALEDDAAGAERLLCALARRTPGADPPAARADAVAASAGREATEGRP